MSKARKHGNVEALERSPSHLLHRVLQFALDLYAQEAGAGAPTQRQYAVLSAVAAREGLTQTDLVRATGIDRSTLADLVARMIAKGLIARERSSADARSNAVRLTAEGRAALDAAAPRMTAADERLLGQLKKGRRDRFISALRDLAAAGDKASAKAEAAAAAAPAAAAGRKKAPAAKPAKAVKPAKPAKAKPAAKPKPKPKKARPEKAAKPLVVAG